MKITIIGAGMMGSAMATPALDNGHTVRLVGTPLDREIIAGLKKNNFHKTLKREIRGDVTFFDFADIASTVNDCDLIVCGVSSFGVTWFAENVLPLLAPGKRVLAITKGLWETPDGTVITFPEHFASLRPDVSFNAVGGPCISFELADRVFTEVNFCGRDKRVLADIRKIFATEYYNIGITDDIKGTETAVALKNAYAMAVSLAIGLYTKNEPDVPEKYNAQAGLFYEASREMTTLVREAGGKDTAAFLGIGDMYVTVFGGRTRRLGVLLGSGMTFAQARDVLSGVTLESVAIIELLGRNMGEKIDRFPLFKQIYMLITRGDTCNIDWSAFREDYFA